MWSDEGINFKWFDLESEEIQDDGISGNWLFASAWNWSGKWEPGTKAAEVPLMRQTNGVTLNHDEFQTLFTEIKAQDYCAIVLQRYDPPDHLNQKLKLKIKMSKQYHALDFSGSGLKTSWTPKTETHQPNLEPSQIVFLKDVNWMQAVWTALKSLSVPGPRRHEARKEDGDTVGQ
jgi:hypothetical protein